MADTHLLIYRSAFAEAGIEGVDFGARKFGATILDARVAFEEAGFYARALDVSGYLEDIEARMARLEEGLEAGGGGRCPKCELYLPSNGALVVCIFHSC